MENGLFQRQFHPDYCTVFQMRKMSHRDGWILSFGTLPRSRVFQLQCAATSGVKEWASNRVAVFICLA